MIDQQQAQIDQQQKQVTQLSGWVKELEDRLSLNSRKSSKPPSTDATKKPGAYPGRPSKTLKRVATPDRVVNHEPEACTDCGKSLESVAGTESSDRRQVFDLPPIRLEVTEHRVINKSCPACGRLNCGQFPAEVKPGVQYGNKIKAFLTNYQLVPWQRSCELISELLHQSIAEGTLAAAINDCSAGLIDVESKIKSAITSSDIVCFDETGLYSGNKRQ